MLQPGLNAHSNWEEIRLLFENPMREAIYAPYANQLA